MKKIIVSIAAALFSLSAFSYDVSDIDFSFAPKTKFTKQNISAEDYARGVVAPKEKATKNKKELPLPDKKLLRGFQRFEKLDAFGEPLPDDFMFYRQNLTSAQKSAYDEIFKAVMNAQDSVQIITRIAASDLPKVSEAVYYDNPEPFWWAGEYSYYYNPQSQAVTQINFKYLFSKSELAQRNKEFFNMSLPVIFYANLLENDMDKIKYIHDYLCLSIDYDTVAYQTGNYGGKLQTAYSAVVEYKTVCAGYSRAFAYYLQQLRIPCAVLHSNEHAWNMIVIDGEGYQIDVTWNDGKQIPPYFNISHAEMQRVQYHTPTYYTKEVIDSYPAYSRRMEYTNYFGNIPIGKPYTYREFSNLQEDIDNPIFAQVYTD